MSRSSSCFAIIRFKAVSGAAILLIGCQSLGEQRMAQAERDDKCGAKPLLAFIGYMADPVTRDAVERRIAYPHRLRWITPGEDILADLNIGRINIELDDKGVIKGVSCY